MNSDRKPDFASQDPRDPSPHQELLDDTRPFRKFFTGCFGVFLILFFVAWYIVLAFIFEEASDGRDAVNWPTTSGQVVDTKVTSHTSTSSSGSGSRTTTSSSTSYIPWVLYRYSVGGLELENDKVQIMTSYDTRAEAMLMTDEYPVGSTVTVYYKPDDPGKSVLVPGISDETLLILNIFTYVPVILFAILVMFWAIKRARRSL
ncbi:MAG: DUF3592 domain-containing protein [Planctomycetota bacterium]